MASKGNIDKALPCLLAGYNVILDYQLISPKGDMNSDGLVSLIDLAFFLNHYSLNTI